MSLLGLSLAGTASAEWALNMPKGITDLLGQVLQWIVDNPQASPNYQKNVALGDAEFEHEVAARMAPEDRHLVNAKQAAVLPYLLHRLGALGT